jgi:hypothetical protein
MILFRTRRKRVSISENKQPEEQLPIGQDFETEVLEEKGEEQTSAVPIKEEESGHYREKNKSKEQRKDQ